MAKKNRNPHKKDVYTPRSTGVTPRSQAPAGSNLVRCAAVVSFFFVQTILGADHHLVTIAQEHTLDRLFRGPRPHGEVRKRTPPAAFKTKGPGRRSGMTDKTKLTRDNTLLVFNCHEP